MASPLLTWIRAQTDGWSPSIVGVFRERASHEWPLTANSPAELRKELTEKGHLLPLPSEPAALANVMEIELREHLVAGAAELDGAKVEQGTERSYPDLEFTGEFFGPGHRAVDIKCARRNVTKKGTATSLKSRIALYTGNTYFKFPDLNFAGILRPFGDYEELLSIVVIYTYRSDVAHRITDVEVVAHETWRLGSTERASATREYIGSVRKIDDLRAGAGDFESSDDFYAYWRHNKRKWKSSPEAERLMQRKIDELSS